jgi:hypothetical protein
MQKKSLKIMFPMFAAGKAGLALANIYSPSRMFFGVFLIRLIE